MSLFWRFFSCQVCFFLLYSSDLPSAVSCTSLNVYDLVYRANFLSCGQFTSRIFFALLHFFMIYFVCGFVCEPNIERRKKTQHKSTKFSLRRRPFICRHAVFEWTAVNNKEMSHCMTQNRSSIAFSLSFIANISKSNVAKGVRNIYCS